MRIWVVKVQGASCSWKRNALSYEAATRARAAPRDQVHMMAKSQFTRTLQWPEMQPSMGLDPYS